MQSNMQSRIQCNHDFNLWSRIIAPVGPGPSYFHRPRARALHWLLEAFSLRAEVPKCKKRSLIPETTPPPKKKKTHPGCCLEIEEIVGRAQDNPQKEENEKCAFHLQKEVDEFIVMSYGLLGNKHIMLST